MKLPNKYQLLKSLSGEMWEYVRDMENFKKHLIYQQISTKHEYDEKIKMPGYQVLDFKRRQQPLRDSNAP